MQSVLSFNIVTSQRKENIMRALSSLLYRLLGPAEEDHLTGAVDLSDSAYCFELLSRHRLEDGGAFFPPVLEAGPAAQAQQ
jgi:hypothetical protein